MLSEASRLILPGGEVLFRAGDEGRAIFVVLTGRLRVAIQTDVGAETVRDVGRGGHVGEFAYLTHQPRSATVTALRDSEILVLSDELLDQLLRHHPDRVLRLAETLAVKARDGREAPAVVPRTIGVVSSEPPDLLGRVSEHLAEALRIVGSVRLLSERSVEAELIGGRHVPDEQERLLRWLHDQETRHSVLLLEATAEDSDWTRLVLRHADRILLLTSATSRPQRGLRELIPTAQQERIELLIVHRRGEYVTNSQTSGWLSLMPFRGHHHVEVDSNADFGRVARGLAGMSIGVVLGGGGARAYAHIGVLAAIEESGISIDRIGGASLGGMIAAQFAYGYDRAGMLRLNREEWVDRWPFRDYTVPLISLFAGGRLRRAVRTGFGQGLIEDLRLPFFCVSTNLTTGRLEVHRTGPIEVWTRAGLSIPGILPPVTTERGEILVDGGIINNLPVDVMRSFGPGPVMAVDVSPSTDRSIASSYGRTPSAWEFARDAVRRSRGPRTYPSILRILQRAALVGSATRTGELRASADLCLIPPVQGFDIFGWKDIDRLAEAGYAYAKAALTADVIASLQSSSVSSTP